jgi:hypothetical protein
LTQREERRHRHLPVEVPGGASDVVTSGPRPFVTSVAYTTADGSRVRWQARAHRRAQPAADSGRRGLTWWIGLLFAVGSACFVLGPVPAYANAVGGPATALTFFVGSLFFTTAAYLSYLQVVRDAGHRWFGWAPRHLGFWATSIQLVGTLFFNVTTFAAFLDVPSEQYNEVVWQPDARGSVCFLVSSAIAFAEAGHRWWSWRPGHRDWQITALNLWGSVFFGVSAVGAYLAPTGEPLNVAWANGGTFLGAVCFLVGSLLMMPEGRQAPVAASTSASTEASG